MPLSSASFSILDAATMGPEFKNAASREPSHTCLYRGESEKNLASVAPYLFPFNRSLHFGRWLVETGWGRSWGVHIVTDVSQEELWRHLRKFLFVKTEEGKELYFRYYDPRVLRLILPTFGPHELKEFFGPVQLWMAEDEDPSCVIKFQLSHSKLRILREPVVLQKSLSAPNAFLQTS